MLSAVLEHVYEPDAMVAAASRLTHPGSLLYIDVPNEASLLAYCLNLSSKLRRKRTVYHLSPTWPPFHLWGFSPTSLRRLLDKHGFEIAWKWVHSDMGFTFPPGLKGQVIRGGAKALGAVANATGTAVNMYVWARRR